MTDFDIKLFKVNIPVATDRFFVKHKTSTRIVVTDNVKLWYYVYNSIFTFMGNTPLVELKKMIYETALELR